MLWVIAPLAIVVLVFLAGFRRTALGLLVAALIAGGLIYRHIGKVQEQAESRIPAADIELGNVDVRRTFDSTYEITGRIKNLSETYRIDGISFNVTVSDCAGKGESACTVLGRATTHVTLTVPPLESRNFTGVLYYGDTHRPAKGRLAWKYEIEAITARRQ